MAKLTPEQERRLRESDKTPPADEDAKRRLREDRERTREDEDRRNRDRDK